ncbi:MAG TPA: hypothetical protein VI306_01995 [Pyrinomonadaceae bacterium]
MRTTKSFIAIVLTIALSRLLFPGSSTQVLAKATEPEPSDGGWPRLYDLHDGGTAVIYQPQVSEWDGERHIVAWTAVSYQEKKDSKPTLGTIKLEADSTVALDQRLVSLTPLRITQFNFSSLSREKGQKLSAELQAAIPQGEQVLSLDRVLANIDKSTIRPSTTNTKNLKADPPRIFHASGRAALIIFDGQPVWSPIKDNNLKYAVNTNWDLFQTPDKTFYLRDEKSWLTSTSIDNGWTPAGKLPDSFRNLPNDENWKEVRANIPGKQFGRNATPSVFISFEPAELIQLKGEPQYVPVAGTSLLWVSNTESDLFKHTATGTFYYLVAGRWFSAPGLDGPWTFATLQLPDDFKRIPPEHPRSRVLASIPGTDEATEAVLLAQVPQTARVNIKEIKAPEVTYQGGKPQFKQIENTSLQLAENTDKQIIKVGDLYYMCFQGVWFMAKSATGPWEVAHSIPQEIYSIPASSPAYNVTYVTVEKDDNDNDDWITFAAVAGYTGMMIAWGCAVWGSGWYYPPYVWYGGFYPAYFWYPPTYGFAAWYNPYTGTFGRGAAVYGPYGGAGGWAAYNPRTGTYARGGAVYGPYGSRGFAQAWNPRTGTYAATRQGGNIYGNWGSSYVQRGDNWAQTAHATNYETGRRTTAARGSEGGAGIHTRGPTGSSTLGRGGNGDIYAGHDGNVYRKQDGQWQKWDNGGWNNFEKGNVQNNRQIQERLNNQTQRPGQGGSGTRSPQLQQLDRDRAARADGAQRIRDNQTYRSGGLGDRSRAGSFRGGGLGGFRGGGLRRH